MVLEHKTHAPRWSFRKVHVAVQVWAQAPNYNLAITLEGYSRRPSKVLTATSMVAALICCFGWSDWQAQTQQLSLLAGYCLLWKNWLSVCVKRRQCFLDFGCDDKNHFFQWLFMDFARRCYKTTPCLWLGSIFGSFMKENKASEQIHNFWIPSCTSSRSTWMACSRKSV